MLRFAKLATYQVKDRSVGEELPSSTLHRHLTDPMTASLAHTRALRSDDRDCPLPHPVSRP